MPFVIKLTGNRHEWRTYRRRVKRLPDGHRSALDAFERYLVLLAPGGTATVQQMFDDLADRFEQGAAKGLSVEEIVGSDPGQFADDRLAEHFAVGWEARERKRLVDAIEQLPGGGRGSE